MAISFGSLLRPDPNASLRILKRMQLFDASDHLELAWRPESPCSQAPPPTVQSHVYEEFETFDIRRFVFSDNSQVQRTETKALYTSKRIIRVYTEIFLRIQVLNFPKLLFLIQTALVHLRNHPHQSFVHLSQS